MFNVESVVLTLRARTVFLNFWKILAILLYWFAAQHVKSFYVKFSAEYNEFSLLKTTNSAQKMAKTKVVRKNANRRSQSKG